MANPKTTKIRLLYERAEREMQQTQPRSCKQCMKPLIGWSGEFCCDWCRSVWLNNHDEGDVIDGEIVVERMR